MKEQIIKTAVENLADIVGFADRTRFDKDDEIFQIMPNVKTVIGLAFRVLRGAYRGIEEGSTYYQYTTMGVENMEEVVMPIALYRVSEFLEENGYTALPQRLNQTIMNGSGDTNPEVAFDAIYRNCAAEHMMNFTDAAIKCGIGELGLSGSVLTDEFGPLIRYCFILTDAEIESTKLYEKHLCDNCKKCVKACPGRAISENGEKNNWQCAVYYNGANGTKNPFLEPNAFHDFENRKEILSGEYLFDEKEARHILRNIYCYPPASHSYQCSICGKACDLECYIHLEKKGLLTKKFKTEFRKREPWKFPIDDFIK